ncbi:MAG: VanZ family protein [Lachnospiraceae bacterium]|nr:VanZ family protein [Lachnospiraceae bacterium]
MKNRTIFFWRTLLVGALVAWMAVIFMFSAKPAEESQEQSYFIGRTIADFIQRLGGLSWSQERKQAFVEAIDFYVRKAAHGTEYAILGGMWMAVFRSFGKILSRSGRFSWIYGTLYAISDEIHQYFVPGRACQVRDMLIDSAGVLVGVFSYFVCAKLWKVWKNGRKLEKK